MWYVAVCTVGYVINIVGSVIDLSIKDGKHIGVKIKEAYILMI